MSYSDYLKEVSEEQLPEPEDEPELAHGDVAEAADEGGEARHGDVAESDADARHGDVMGSDDNLQARLAQAEAELASKDAALAAKDAEVAALAKELAALRAPSEGVPPA